MRRALEVIFRHPIRLLLLVVVLPVVSAAVAFALPRTYQASATLWASEPFVVVASGVGTTYTPAASQKSVLTELLQTRSFALAVANDAGLGGGDNTSSAQDDALVANISGNVHINTTGDNLLTITYANKNPDTAQKVVQATVRNYGEQAIAFETKLSQQLLDYDQQQLTQAQQAVMKDTQATAAYVSSHATETPQQLAADPQYMTLQAQQQQAQTALTSLQNQIDTLKYSVAAHADSTDNLYTIIDPATVPDHGVSRSKELLLAGGGGLLVSLLAIVMYITVLMRRDRAIYSAYDLSKVTDRPLLGAVPVLRSGTTTTWQIPAPSEYVDAQRR